MSSHEWISISSNELFTPSIVYSYKEWRSIMDQDYERIETPHQSTASNEWDSMMRSGKPPKVFQYVKRATLSF